MEINNEIELMKLQEDAIEKRRMLEADLATNNNPWGYSPLGIEAKSAAMAMLSTKNGLYARIPITCKAEGCPYSSSCTLLQYGLAPIGEKCAHETALIESFYESYKNEFDLTPETSFVDHTLIKELISADIMMERAQSLISQEGVLLEEIYSGTNERTGEDFFQKEVSKALDIYERHSKARDRILDNMMGTRKAKSKLKNNTEQSVMDVLAESMAADFVIEDVPEQFK